MNDQSDSHASTLGTISYRHEPAQKLSLTSHKIDLEKSYIQLNKHQLDFSRLTHEIKYFFIEVYKKCFAIHCLPTIFKSWMRPNDKRKHPKSIRITDSDAILLLSKMLKALDLQLVQKRIRGLKGSISQRTSKLNHLQQLKKQIIDKMSVLNAITESKGNTILSQEISCSLQEQLKEIDLKLIEHSAKTQALHANMNRLSQTILYSEHSALMNQSMNKTISKMARNLLKQTILFIIQGSNSPTSDACNVFVVFQQSYSTVCIPRNSLVRLIGSQVYLQKVKTISQSDHSQLFCCHSCMRMLPSSSLKHCSNKVSAKETKSYISSDYVMYRNNVINSDFFTQTAQHVLPYFAYSRSPKEQLCCNRSYCVSCLQDFYKVEFEEDFKCPFCFGKCNCRRCQMAVALVKCIAYDIEFDPDLKSSYHEILRLLSLESKYATDSLPLRDIGSTAEFSFLSVQSIGSHQQLATNTTFNNGPEASFPPNKENEQFEISVIRHRDNEMEEQFLHFGWSKPNDDLLFE